MERPLTTGEIALARSVYGDAIDYAPVTIRRRKWAFFQPKHVVMAPLGHLHFHPAGDLYRDDFAEKGLHPQCKPTVIPFDVEGRHIILIDDVLYTGRTVRAALDALIDYGRPRTVELAVLVDRGLRELPIRAEYVGLSLQTTRDQLVRVHLQEIDDEDRVILQEKA